MRSSTSCLMLAYCGLEGPKVCSVFRREDCSLRGLVLFMRGERRCEREGEGSVDAKMNENIEA
jgi:hypothetical protein